MKKLKPYILMFPALLAFAIFVFVPFIYTLYLSFFDWNMIKPTKKFVGLSNYALLVNDPILRKIFINTFFYILIMLILNFIIPYILAFVSRFMISKFQNFYKKTFFLPSILSLVIGSILFVWILNPVAGPVAIILRKIGLAMPNWSKTEGWVIAGLSLTASWKSFGYNYIVLLGGILGIDESVIEAAKLEGIGNFKLFKDIVIPMSSATGIYVLITSIVQGLQFIFTPIKVVTQGGPNYASSNLIYQSYHEAFVYYRTGVSAALSMITMLIFAILLFLEYKYIEKGVYYEN